MLVEIDKLITVMNYSKNKKISRQHVYRLANNNEITLVTIDNVSFVYMDEKTEHFKRKRKEKSNNKENQNSDN